MNRHNGMFLFLALGFLMVLPVAGMAQYFISQHGKREVLESGKYDSVVLLSASPFALPRTNDTVPLTYHEPLPDSIMPTSAIVIGRLSVQEEHGDDVVPVVEEYARKLGADWLVSFQEPRPVILKDGWKVYRSHALLLHVLDGQFIKASHIEYTYDEPTKLTSFAAVNQWYDQYGTHYGAELQQPAISKSAEMTTRTP